MTKENTGLNLTDITSFVEDNDLQDLTISTGGGDFKRELLPVKNHAIRLVGYTELGIHKKKKFQSDDTDDVDTVRLTFEVLSKDGIRLDDDGKPVGARRLYLECKKSTHEKSTLRKLFELMREGDTTITHFAQMIGVKAWKLKVNWEQNGEALQSKKAREDALAAMEADKENKKELRIWESWKTSGVPNISPAVNPIMDEDGEDTGEVTQMKVPPVVGKLEFFLWDKPQPAHWASLFIDGEYENTDKDGKVTKVSKNRVQNTIIQALNYDGSPLQCMLDGVEFDDAVIDETSKKQADDDRSEENEPAETKEEVGQEDEPAKDDDGSDDIDELGL